MYSRDLSGSLDEISRSRIFLSNTDVKLLLRSTAAYVCVGKKILRFCTLPVCAFVFLLGSKEACREIVERLNVCYKFFFF